MKKLLLLTLLATTTLVGCGTKDLEKEPANVQIQAPTVEQGTITMPEETEKEIEEENSEKETEQSLEIESNFSIDKVSEMDIIKENFSIQYRNESELSSIVQKYNGKKEIICTMSKDGVYCSFTVIEYASAEDATNIYKDLFQTEMSPKNFTKGNIEGYIQSEKELPYLFRLKHGNAIVDFNISILSTDAEITDEYKTIFETIFNEFTK